ncbi:MAG TPA: tRNA pseudouridine(13) synthase TruD [Anaeromyxobacteraceae bacterium]|nr:tRNA pseudouridine(13) synthase TruD [Anaeromyxobacteraceae bacterium]
MSGAAARLPWITADVPGSGGAVKASPEDFRVDEIPAYLPSGQGEHLYLHVEKRGRTTRDVVRALAAALGVDERDAGVAGLKDRQAVTTQWLSFHTPRDPDPASLSEDGFRVLSVSRHANKLRTGHSRGNRFQILVRGGDTGAARACAAALAERGFPNFFGPQRFGVAGRNADLGRAILIGRLDDPDARRAARDRFLRRLCLSAWQSLLFNRWLEERIRDGLFERAVNGDVMKKLETGGVFTCSDAAVDGERVRRFEISPAGPMFGHKLRPAEGEAAEREARILAAEGIGQAELARAGGEAEGTRRAGRLPLQVELEATAEGYRAAFELPRGSYATVVMGELVKGEADLAEAGDGQ